MQKILRHLSPTGIQSIPLPEQFNQLGAKDAYWLEIKTDQRKEAAAFCAQLGLDDQMAPHIIEPEVALRMQIFSDAILLNLPVATNDHFTGQGDFLTIIAANNLVVTILNSRNEILTDLEAELINNPFDLQLNLYLILYFIVSEILQKNLERSTVIRKKINVLSARLENDPESVDLNEIIECKRELGNISNIVEDQFHLLGFLPKFDWDHPEETKQFRSEFTNLFRGLEYLLKTFARMEDKLTALNLQYQLFQNEKSNKRLNTLTIVQAIFVPATLLAGIYGMNFKNMPELNWEYSYFVLLGIMTLIAIVELWYFKRKGWFD